MADVSFAGLDATLDARCSQLGTPRVFITGRTRLHWWPQTAAWCMDRACEGHETRQLAQELGFAPVVPPNPNRVEPWEYDRVTYRRRHEVERLHRRLKGDRRVFTRYDKLDVMFLAFVHLALIFDALR